MPLKLGRGMGVAAGPGAIGYAAGRVSGKGGGGAIATPQVAIPLADAPEGPPNTMLSWDGSRYIPLTDLVNVALELNVYCTHAFAMSDDAYYFLDAYEIPSRVRPMVSVDGLQSVRQTVYFLRAMADAYEAAGLAANKHYSIGGDWSRVVTPEGETLRDLWRGPEDWRDLADELEGDYLSSYRIDVGPAEGVGALPALALWAIIALAGAIVVTAVTIAVSRATAYARMEGEAIRSRLACVDEATRDLREASTAAEKEAAAARIERCHSEAMALISAAEARAASGGLAGVASGLGMAFGAVAVAAVVWFSTKGK